MAINRFSKEARPAEFNPLTADEIMRVPLLKGQMEQEQLAAIEDKRLEMLNVDVAPGDIERVRAEQSRMSGQFDDLVGRITTEGVGHRTTDAVNKFMRDYNTTTSKSGVIGNAAQFAASRKAKREEDRKLAIAKGYDMAQWDKLYQAHEGRQQSVDAEGNLTAEFQNLNLPSYIDPKKMFRDLIKGKLGSTKVGTTLGEYEASNLGQLQAAGDQVMNAYYNDPDFRQVMDDLGYTEEDIQKQVANEAAIALEEAFVEYQQAPLTEAQRATQAAKALKLEEEQNAEAARAGETILAEHTAGITEASSNLTSPEELAKLKANAESSDDQSAMDAYLRAVQKNTEVEDAFAQDQQGQNVKAGLDAAISAITGTGDKAVAPEFEGTYEEAAAYVEEQRKQYGSAQVAVQTPTGTQYVDAPETKGTDNTVMVQKPDGKYVVYSKGDQRIQTLERAKEAYDAAYADFSGPNMLHSQRVFFSPHSDAVGGTGKGTNYAALTKIRGDLEKVVQGPSGDVAVTEMVGTYTNSEGEVIPIATDLTSDDNAAIARDKIQSLSNSEIKNADIKFALDTDTRPGAVKVTFTTKELVEGEGSEPVEVRYTATMDMLGDETSEWGILLSQGLAGANVNQTRALINERQEMLDQKGVIPTPKAIKGYGNSDAIVNFLKRGDTGKRLLSKTKDADFNVYTVRDDEGRNAYSLRTKESRAGAPDYTITNENVLEGYDMVDMRALAKKNIDLYGWIVEKYSKEKNIPANKIQTNDPEFVAWRINLQSGDKGVEHFAATSKSELLNILKK